MNKVYLHDIQSGLRRYLGLVHADRLLYPGFLPRIIDPFLWSYAPEPTSRIIHCI